VFIALCASGQAQEPRDVERRVISYIKDNLKPGEPLVVSKLYNEVFTAPEERKVLDKLNRAFFRIPLFLVEHNASAGRLPTLDEIAGQFDLEARGDADVVLSIMESDPRVPKFIARDPETRELTGIDLEKIKADKRFNQAVERSLIGWEGKPAPEVTGSTYEGEAFSLSQLRGKTVLLYLWFTNCPPCVRIAPELVALHEKLQDRGFTVVGANADRVLGLQYDDAVRAEYATKLNIRFPLIHLTPEARTALGDVNIFPTLFLIDSQGTISKYYVNYQVPETLEKDVAALGAQTSARADTRLPVTHSVHEED
jgi:thiol-disulfide isomerase/thioredoxin